PTRPAVLASHAYPSFVRCVPDHCWPTNWCADPVAAPQISSWGTSSAVQCDAVGEVVPPIPGVEKAVVISVLSSGEKNDESALDVRLHGTHKVGDAHEAKEARDAGHRNNRIVIARLQKVAEGSGDMFRELTIQ